MSKFFQCTVCGFPSLPNKPADHEICPSCGTQFGYDDYTTSHAELRAKWLAAGANFFIKALEPHKWNPYRQLQEAGLLIAKEKETKTTTGAKTGTPHGYTEVPVDGARFNLRRYAFIAQTAGTGTSSRRRVQA